MIYQLLKPFIRILFRLYFRKLYFSGEEKIPSDRSVLFAVNHPTAFLDPIFVAAHIKPTTSFLLRGDLFGKPIVIWFLRQINTIPIFRFRDGYKNLKNNHSTFDYCHELLGRGEHLLILAEGQTEHEKRLRPIQKGTARLLLGAYEQFPKGKYCILPIGVNYTAANQLRSELMVDIGDPILLEDYMEAHNENPRKAIKKITDEITRQLKERVVHIDRDEDTVYTNKLLCYKRNDRNSSLLPYRTSKRQAIEEEMHLTQSINNADVASRSALKKKVDTYEALLTKRNIKDIAVAHPEYLNTNNIILLVFGFPFFIAGYLFHYLPFLIGKNTADRKVKKPAFYGSIRFAVALLFYIFPTLILLIIALITLSWKILVGILLFYLLTYISLHYTDLFAYWNEARKWGALSEEEQEELLVARGELGLTFNP